MNSNNRLPQLGIVCALAAFFLGTSSARAVFVVAPNSLAVTEGISANTFPFYPGGLSIRYQQVYAASQFSSLGGAGDITELRFRLDGNEGFAFSETISNIEIRLSTTSMAPDGLSATFASNVGADSTLVYSGALTLSSSSSGPGPRPFDIIITLQNSFTYNPANGNLLLDVTNFDSSTLDHFFDAQQTIGDSISRVYVLGDPSSTSATVSDTGGLVTQFNFSSVPVAAVPEPASACLMAVGGLGLFVVRRLRRESA